MSDMIAHTTGEVIEVRCTLPGCPQPLIGAFLPEWYGESSADCASETHLWTHHILPQRMKDTEGVLNTLASVNVAMAGRGLRFAWEKSEHPDEDWLA